MLPDLAHAATRRLPAFGLELLDLRYRNLVPKPGWCGAHVLIVVDSWSIAAARWRLIVPAEDDPLALDFRGAAGLDCIIVYNSKVTECERLNAAIRAVLRGNPSSLATFDVRAPHQTRIVKSHAVGRELAEFADA